MHPPSSPVRRSSRSNKGVTSKFDDYMTGDELDISNLSTSCSQCYAHVRTQQNAPNYIQYMASSSQLPTPQPTAQSYQYQPYHPYQHYTTQNMAPVLSPDKNRVFVSGLNDPAENRVFVSDGYSWKEYNLEKVFSW